MIRNVSILARDLTWLVFLGGACAASHGDRGAPEQAVDPVSTGIAGRVSAQAVRESALTASNFSIKVDGPCNPATDGWKPEPIAVTDQQQAEIDRGEDPDITPPGYVDKAPIGEPFCVGYPILRPGEGTPEEVGVWRVECASDRDCPEGSLCPLDETPGVFCAVACSSEADCLSGQVCRKYGDKGTSSCACGPPDWCGHPPTI